MKFLRYTILFSLFFLFGCSQNQLNDEIVEASCGQCQFGMKTETKSCDLAIRYLGKAYFVKGTGIDDHGDAHAGDGFCQRIRQAQVTGVIQDDIFIAEKFNLLPLSEK